MKKSELKQIIKEEILLLTEETDNGYSNTVKYNGKTIMTFTSHDASVGQGQNIPKDVISDVKILNEKAVAYLIFEIDWPKGVTVTGFDYSQD